MKKLFNFAVKFGLEVSEVFIKNCVKPHLSIYRMIENLDIGFLIMFKIKLFPSLRVTI